MRKLRRARALTLGLALGFAGTQALFAGCAQEDEKEGGACQGANCAASAPPLDFSKGSATFTAHLRVLDGAGKPLAKADVQVGKSKGATDADGRVALKGVDAKGVAVVQVSSKSAAPYVGKTDAFSSGQRTQNLSLGPLAFREQVDLEQTVTVQKDFGRLELEANSIADKSGTRANKATLELADLAHTKAARDELSLSFKALDRKGQPTSLKSLDALAHVKLTDAAGNELNLATTKAATLELALPKDNPAKLGDVLPLWSLDESTLTLTEEASCVVNARQGKSAGDRVCKGHVPHFSIWAVAEAAPQAPLQCLNARVTIELSRCFKVEVERVYVEGCDENGEECREAPFRELALAPVGGAVPSTCGLVADSPTQRVVALYDVDASACSGADKDKGGRRLKRSDARVTAGQAGSELYAAFARSASTLCEETCGARELRITGDDLEAAALVDLDDDGYFARADGVASADCDDGDASVFPSAPELFCSEKDTDCDGQAGSEVDDATFNASCALCGTEGREQPGNLRDEDCDGSAEDRDGDGYAEPEDCDDFDANSAPNQPEVPGNQRDEDCDGVMADWDGDGRLSSSHLYLAQGLGLSASSFGDCDDFDASIHPGAVLASEAGALRDYFDMDTRVAGYCDLFDDSGRPSASFHTLLVDRNCDGRVTDADGDGYAAIGDNSLGAALASDCDDLDPRVHVQALGGGCAGGVTLDDERMCRAAPRQSECPALGLSGGFVQTTCEEALDRGVGTGNGVCAFNGWSEGDPLTLEPGRLWGPCDGGGPLPECPSGAQCGGPLPMSDANREYLESKYTAGQPLVFAGMCFPKCTL